MIKLQSGANLPYSLPRPILSKRQEQVRRMIFEEGFTTKEVCSKLNITEKTLKFHLTDIYKAYGVNSKYELLFKLLKNKLYQNGINF